jgi:chromosome segregation ATPase
LRHDGNQEPEFEAVDELDVLRMKLCEAEKSLSELQQSTEKELNLLKNEKSTLQGMYDICKASLTATQENLDNAREEITYCQSEIENGAEELLEKDKRIGELEGQLNESRNSLSEVEKFYQVRNELKLVLEGEYSHHMSTMLCSRIERLS